MPRPKKQSTPVPVRHPRHCSCITCWELEHPEHAMDYEPEEPYDPLNAMGDYIEDSGYDPLEYFNK